MEAFADTILLYEGSSKWFVQQSKPDMLAGAATSDK